VKTADTSNDKKLEDSVIKTKHKRSVSRDSQRGSIKDKKSSSNDINLSNQKAPRKLQDKDKEEEK
jgi:hypothetical protein